MDLRSVRIFIRGDKEIEGDSVVKRRLCLVLLLSALAFGQAHRVPEPHANCCLCMCRAHDETKCSAMCIRLQHGKKIVEEPEMIKCTAECKRVHVVEVK